MLNVDAQRNQRFQEHRVQAQEGVGRLESKVKMKMPHTLDLTKLPSMFEELLEQHREKLTKWEQSFIESVADQYDRHGKLSEKQLEILEAIWQKV